MNATGQRGRESVFMRGELFVVLFKSFLANFASWRDQQLSKRRIAELDLLAFLVFDHAELQVSIAQLPERLARSLRHLALHGQQVFFVVAERMVAIARDPLKDQAIFAKLRRVEILLHRRGWNG